MKIIAVSDVHLGYSDSDHDAFSRFLDRIGMENVDHLVLLGDIFDFWRRTNSNVVKDMSEIIEKLFTLRTKMQVHYLVGNHDYLVLKFAERFGKDYPFTVTKNLRLCDNRQGFYFTHGYDLDVIDNMEPFSVEEYEGFAEKMCYSPDSFGSVASFFWGIVEWMGLHLLFRRVNLKSFDQRGDDFATLYSFTTSPGVNMFLGKDPGDYLVFGHTHRPFVHYKDKEKTVATVINTGSWIKGTPNQNSYALIIDGKMSLEQFVG